MLLAALGGLFLARAAYVGLNWVYYSENLGEAIETPYRGLAWQGALGGGVIGVVIACGVRRRSVLDTLDALTPGAAVLASCAWLACTFVGCAYGVETYPQQGLLWTLSLDLPDLHGIRQPRVAVQHLGAMWSALLVGILFLAERSLERRGMVFGLWLTLHSLGCFSLGVLRADSMLSVGGWRIDQLINLALGLAGGALLVFRAVGDRKRRRSQWSAGLTK